MSDGFYYDEEVVQDSTVLFTKSPRSLYQEYMNNAMPNNANFLAQANAGGGNSPSNPAPPAALSTDAKSTPQPGTLRPPGTASSSAPKLRKISSDAPLYSSTAVMLKRSRAEVEEYTKDLGAVNAILELPVSEDVRRTVAKIFSDPRNAEAISESEWRQREHRFQANKEVFGEKMGEHLRRERDVLGRELQQLSK